MTTALKDMAEPTPSSDPAPRFTGNGLVDLIARNDASGDGTLAELIGVFNARDFFTVGSALRNSKDFDNQIFNAGVGAQFVNGSAVDGITIRAIAPTASLPI